uniref:Uncharacterized protein n=1 Tax=Suricata suricatta TaxID=37032 RepID=A0A673UU30_SURSU
RTPILSTTKAWLPDFGDTCVASNPVAAAWVRRLHDHQPLALLRQAQEREEAHQQLQQQQQDVGQPPGGGTRVTQTQPRTQLGGMAPAVAAACRSPATRHE